MNEEKEKGVQQRIRIYNIEIWDKITTLEGTKKFKGFNDVINQALEIGVPLLFDKIMDFEEYYNKVKKIKTDLLEKNVREINITSDEMYITTQIIKTLVATLYNIEVAKLKDEPISGDIIESGLFGELPKNLQEIEENFNKRLKRRYEK